MSENPRYEINTQHVEDHLGEIKTQHLEEIKTQHLEEIKTLHLEEVKTQHLQEIKTQHLEESDRPVTSTNIESTRQPMTDLDSRLMEVSGYFRSDPMTRTSLGFHQPIGYRDLTILYKGCRWCLYH